MLILVAYLAYCMLLVLMLQTHYRIGYVHVILTCHSRKTTSLATTSQLATVRHTHNTKIQKVAKLNGMQLLILITPVLLCQNVSHYKVIVYYCCSYYYLHYCFHYY